MDNSHEIACSDNEIISQFIEANHRTIFACGTLPSDFAWFCQQEINEHRKDFPEERLIGISFEKTNLGYDNYEITPMFKYK